MADAQIVASTAGKTIVSYDNIIRPFPDIQTLLGTAREAAGKVIADPARADTRVVQLSAALNDLQASQKNSRVMNTPRNPMAAQLQTHLAQKAQQENKLESFILRSVDFVLESFEIRFGKADWLGYMLTFFTWIEDLVPATCPKPASSAAAPIPNKYRIAVIGDWGTGMYGAPVCAASIRDDSDGYDLVLHLGDVYYSGLPDEVEDRFEKFWPQPAGAIGRSLNGNHEMYTGGHGYFETLLPYLNQGSSYFAFQNDFWTLVMLDTSYNQPFGGQEGDLFPAQMDWLDGIIQGAGDRKIVLFSHHQPFSLLDANQGPKLVTWLEKYLQARRIFAWYWGHEHRSVLYDPHPAWGFHGRCVGHGGFPEARVDLSNAPFNDELGSQWRQVPAAGGAPGAYVLDSANLYIPTFETQFAPHGFMRLELQGNDLTEYVRAPDNANIYLKPLA